MFKLGKVDNLQIVIGKSKQKLMRLIIIFFSSFSNVCVYKLNFSLSVSVGTGENFELHFYNKNPDYYFDRKPNREQPFVQELKKIL